MSRQIIAQNRSASFHYSFLEVIEAGIVLTGSEVKGLRLGRGTNIQDAYAGIGGENNTEIFLFNVYIEPYQKAKHFNHEAKRPRKLLLKKRQIKKLIGLIKIKGITIIPIALYFNKKGIAKVEIALAKSKNVIDKRETIKKREWSREKSRIMKEHNS
ncbi:MAG: SsrA-binding protein SmpB [Alphaproteobacteria bacterium]